MSSDAPDTPDAADLPDLDALRIHIDDVDRRLVELLSERARIVVDIGQRKRGDGTPIYAPHRERQVIERALAANPGPLSARTIEAIYRELMSGSFSLELPLRVAYLGPPGSFSHVAAARHFGSSVEHADLPEIEAVFEEIARGHCHYGLVPYENSIGGSVTDTLDAFVTYGSQAAAPMSIYAEALIEVSQTLLSNAPADRIEVIYSKPQAFAQCRRWLSRELPDAKQVAMPSTSAAAQRAADESNAAAIGSTLAGEIYGLKARFEHIEDNPNNITRFLIIGREAAKPTGDDKTTLMFATSHKPGALVDVLAVFRDAPGGGINLSHIDKRPSGRTNWEYTFFIDGDAHRDDPVMARAIEDARQHCLALYVLGSYPRAQRVL